MKKLTMLITFIALACALICLGAVFDADIYTASGAKACAKDYYLKASIAEIAMTAVGVVIGAFIMKYGE